MARRTTDVRLPRPRRQRLLHHRDVTAASSAAASIRLAHSRTISSSREPSRVEPSALTTVSTGVPFPTDAANVGLLDDHDGIIREGTPSVFLPEPIHRS